MSSIRTSESIKKVLNGLKIGDKWIKGMIKKGISKFILEEDF